MAGQKKRQSTHLLDINQIVSLLEVTSFPKNVLLGMLVSMYISYPKGIEGH